ncbi:hypothetical protein Droror1_Dr00003409 [Drosera rotundifolia]
MPLSNRTNNPSGYADRRSSPAPAQAQLFLKLIVFVILMMMSAIAVESESVSGSGSGSGRFEWRRVTAKNFSSQIRIHPHVLLIVAVPWSGGYRSLTREITKQLSHDEEKFGSLKLMAVYGNHDPALANSLGATEGITILCYHHGTSFKYKGRHRARDILASVGYLMSLAPGQLPLETIANSEALEAFTDSTDKSLLLLESCGWTAYLLSQHGNQTSQGGIFSRSFYEETHRTLTSGSLKNLKDFGNEKLTCGIVDGFNGMPWLGSFTSENLEADPVIPSFGPSCSFEEYRKFSSFFSNLSKVARNSFLPPQRQKFGHVYERSFLDSLSIDDAGPWSLIIYYAGCPGCSKVIKEEKHISDVIEMHGSPFVELIDGDRDLEATLPADRPSVLLFVDRLSDSPEIRKKSEEALDALRDVASHFQFSYRTDGWVPGWPIKSSSQVNQGSSSVIRNPRFSVSHLSQNIKLEDKMSVVIIKEGKHVPLDNVVTDAHAGPLHEILSYLLGPKKQIKLSSVAKEAGFQLLSDDLDIEKPEPSLDQQEGLAGVGSSQASMEDLSGSVLDVEKDHHLTGSSLTDPNEQPKPDDTKPSFQLSEKLTEVEDLASELSASRDSHPSCEDQMLDSAENDLSDKEVDTDSSEDEQHDFQVFSGSFFFSDGGYQLLRSLTSEAKVPTMVIIDPISEEHYIFPEVSNFSNYSISDFLNCFLNGSLVPFQRSAPLESARQAVYPPFVNLDFPEKDSIPAVTADTFYDLVLGANQSTVQADKSGSKRGVVVLFSNSWCGFCQRMDLVVREVYRAFKGYADVIKGGTEKKKLGISKDDDITQSLPMIYRMDCTLNECGGVLKSMGQREGFPTLLLFPAKNQSAVPYEGDISVVDIIEFIAVHDSSFLNLVEHKGTLWTEPEKRAATYEELSEAKERYYEVLKQSMKRRIPVRPNQVRINGDEPTEPNVGIGTFLVATDKLLGSLFHKATILIVSADHAAGFQGLIVNRHVDWDSLPELDYIKLLKQAPVSFGGPVMHPELPLVALTRTSVEDRYPQVLPGVYYLDQVTTFHEIVEIKAGNWSVTDLWFFWGYSGWNWNQLFDEIAEGSWSLHNGGVEDLHWP